MEFMKKVFLDIKATSNNLSTARIVAYAITIVEFDEIILQDIQLVKSQKVMTLLEEERISISNMMVRNAPVFVDLASNLIENLENSRVHFINNFSEKIWRKSFKEIGFSTGRSSLILQNFLKEYGIDSKNRTLGQIAESLKVEKSLFDYGLNSELLRSVFAHLALDNSTIENFFETEQDDHSGLIKALPSKPGVYYFKDEFGNVIYVGKAIDIKQRVASHFKSKLSFERILSEKTKTVEFSETGNELIALLKESSEIQYLKPEYNTQQINDLNPWVIEDKIDSKGILRLLPIEKNYTDFENTISFNRASVIEKLKLMQLLFNLCLRFLNIERTSGSCSYKRCKGICRGEESRSSYNERAKNAFKSIRLSQESYYLKLKGRNASERSFILVKDGIYQGYGFVPESSTINSIEDLEAYIITQANTYFTSRSISQYLKKRGVEKYLFI